jgi:hypothetical protein
MTDSRRYEILLPLKFNNGQPVPWRLVAETIQELKHHFGGVSGESQIIHGIGEVQHAEFRDDLVRVYVDVPDTLDNRQFFQNYKAQLKTRFQQLEIWMITFPVEVV